MNLAQKHNAGAYLKSFAAVDPTTITAGGATDNVEQHGIVIDRNDIKELALSAIFSALVKTTGVSGGDTASVTITPKDSADGVTFAALGDATVDSFDANSTFTVQANVKLAGAKRFLRFDYTINLSAASVDTAQIGATVLMGPFQASPATVVTEPGESS